MSNRIFFDRRSGSERRISRDKRTNPRLDLSHKRRRKNDDRRHLDRNTSDDFYASKNAYRSKLASRLPQKH